MIQAIEVEPSEAIEVTAETVVTSETQQRLVVLANDTRTRVKRGALDIYHIGANLLEAQSLLGHGDFLPWIATEFDMSQSSAYRFMEVGRAFQDKLPNLGNFEIAASTLYQLASSSTPESAREEVVELAANGEVVTTDKAKGIIEKHTPAARKPRAAASLSSDRAGGEPPQTIESASATYQFVPGDVVRIKPNGPKDFVGQLVVVTQVHDEIVIVFKTVTAGILSSMVSKFMEPVEINPSHILGKLVDKGAIPDNIALDLLCNFVQNKESPRQLREEVLKLLNNQ